MDADSSYGGSDTAHDGTLGQDSNSMDTPHSNPSHDPTNTNSHSSPDSSNYYKNEISLPVNCDEGDFQKNGKTPTLPHYLSTANFNIDATLENHNNLEELNKKYRSSQRLNETPKSSKKGNAGLDNPAYLDDENVKVSNDDTMGYKNGNLNSSPKLGHENEPQAEAVNLELINLKPNGKDVTGPYENGKGISGIPVKKDNFESGTPYDEYFVPVNEHRKYMRGEKLYVTKDKREKSKRNKCVCWSLCLIAVAAVIILGILAALGIIGNPEAQPIEEGRHFGGSSSTDSIKSAGGLFGSNIDGKPMESEKTPITPSPPSSTVPSLPPTTPKPFSEVTVPRTLQSQFKIDNLQYEPELGNKNSSEFRELAEAIEEELKSILFTRDVLNYGSAEIELKVLEFSPGSVVVKFRVGWVMKDGIHNAKDPIDRDVLEKKLRNALAYNHGYIANYRIADDSVTVETVIDLCKTNKNNGCEYNCSFSYKIEDFICECPEGQYILEDGKKCGQQHQLPTEDSNHVHGFEHSNEGDGKEHEQIATTVETSSVSHTEKPIKIETTMNPTTQTYASSSHEPNDVSEEQEQHEEHEQREENEHVTPVVIQSSTHSHTTIQEPIQETSVHVDNIQEEYHPVQLPIATTTTTQEPVTHEDVNGVVPLATEKGLEEEEEKSTETKYVDEHEQSTTGSIDSHSHNDDQAPVHTMTTTAEPTPETTTQSQSPMYWENETNQPIQETSLPSRNESVDEHQEEERKTTNHVSFTTFTPIHEESEEEEQEEEEEHMTTEVHLPITNESHSSERTEPVNVSHVLEETEPVVKTTTETIIETPKPFEIEVSEHENNATPISHVISSEQMTTTSSVSQSVTINPTTTENSISIHPSSPQIDLQPMQNSTTMSPIVTVSESISVTNTYTDMENTSDSDRQPKFDITLGHTPVEPEMEYHTHDHEDEDERETIPLVHQEVEPITTESVKTEEETTTISNVEEQRSHTENSSLQFGVVNEEDRNSMMATNETDGTLSTTLPPNTSEESQFVHHTSPPSFLESSEEEVETHNSLMEDSNESSSTAHSLGSDEMKDEPAQTTTSSEMETTSDQETSTSTEDTFSGRSFESNHPALFASDHENMTSLEDNSTISKQMNDNGTLHRPLSPIEDSSVDDRQELTTSTVAPRLDNDEKNVTNPLDPNVTDVALGVLPLEEDESVRLQNSSRSTDNTEVNTITNMNETENTSMPEMIGNDNNTITSTTYSTTTVENSTQESANITSPVEKPLNDTDIEIHRWEDTATTISNEPEQYNEKGDNGTHFVNGSSTESVENVTTENVTNDEEHNTSLSLFNALEPITVKHEQPTNMSGDEYPVNVSTTVTSNLMETSNGTNDNNDMTISQLESYDDRTNETHTNNDTSNSNEDLIAMETTTTSLQKSKVFSNVSTEESTMINNETLTNHSPVPEVPDSSKTISETKEKETSTESQSFGDDSVITMTSHNETSHLYEVHEVTDDITTPIPARTFNYSPLPVIPLTEMQSNEDEKRKIESDNLYNTNLNGINDISDEKENYSTKYYYSDKKKEFSKTVDTSTTENIQSSNNTDQEEDHLIATDFVSRTTITDKPNNITIEPVNNLSSTQTNSISDSTEPPVYNVTSEVKPVVEGFTLSSFSRCSAGQFQCVNGTSTKGGSYCVSNSDRCDSVKDCTDGSDELGCDQENCKDNFQCKSGQCLKRHLVCDGIFNCDDNSDEENCESWKCNFDELSCGDGKRCIPLSWKCDGKSHCFDGRDEQNCHSQPCESNHFYCSEQDSCIPASWRCDGVNDCKSGEDERLCECGIDQFKCQTGGGCIQAENRCDGIEQCPDLSDEWNCLRLRKTNDTSDTSSYLEALVSNNSWQPICADLWNTTYSDFACQSMGYAKATSTNYKIFEKSSSSTQFLKINPSQHYGASLLAQLLKTDSCDNVVTLACQENVCGNNNGLEISSFGSKTENGNEKEWPSIALLFNRRYQIQCTANIVTPNWVIASYSCLYSLSGQPSSSNPYDWELLAGGNNFFDSSVENSSIQSRSVKNIVPYPQAKYSQFIYRNNIALVQLVKPLDLEKNISAVCLPPQNEEPNQYCITVGWSMKKPGESSLKGYLRYLPDLNQNKMDCNSSDHYNGRFTSDLLCVDHLTTNEPCEDNQGAPLMCFSESSQNWELRGLLSLDGNCQRFHRPSLFTSTSGEIGTWIENTIGTKPKPFNNKLQ